MRDEKKIQYYRQKTIEELEEVLNDPNLSESDSIIATIEKQHKEEKLGVAIYYTTEEVLSSIFGKVKLA